MPPADIGMVFVSGGFQYRTGSHRQTVRLARHLADAGMPSLRFDLTGLGDATGATQSFEHLSPQLSAAINTLFQHVETLRGVTLWGLCDGASASLLHWGHTRDPRIAGLALVNPWVRSEASLAHTHVKHYYLRRLRDKAFWQKLFSGGVGAKAVYELLSNLRKAQQTTTPPACFQERMAIAWRECKQPILLMISEDDITGQEFMHAARQAPMWADGLQHLGLTHVCMPEADHTCTSPEADQTLMQQTLDWLVQLNQRRT